MSDLSRFDREFLKTALALANQSEVTHLLYISDTPLAPADLRGRKARKKLQRQLRYFNTRKATAEVQAPAKDAVVGIGSRVRYTLNGTERAVTFS